MEKMVSNKIRRDKILILIFILALILRLGILYYTQDYYFGSGLSVGCGEMARNLVNGNGLVFNNEFMSDISKLQTETHRLIDIQEFKPPRNEVLSPDYAHLPGYAILLAFTYLLFGEQRYIYLQIIQAVIDAFGVFLIFWIGKILFDRKIGLISAFLFAIWITEARLSVVALYDAPMTFIYLLSLFFFINAVLKESNKYYIFSAITLGLGSYIRPDGMLLPIYFGLALFIYNYKKQKNFDNIKNVFKKATVMILIIMLILSPVAVRNYSITGHAFVTPPPGQGLWEGFGEFDNPVGAVCDDEKAYEVAIKEGHDVKYGSLEFQKILFNKSTNVIKEYPIWWISIVLRRIPRAILFANSIPLTDPKIKNVSFIKSMSSSELFINYVKMYPDLFIARVLTVMISLGLPLFAFIGIWLRRKDWRKISLLICLPAYTVVTLSLIHIEPRYILPATSVFIIFSAITLDYIYTKAKNFMKRREDISE